MATVLNPEGRIFRDGERTVIEVPWSNGKYVVGKPGVEVVNPDAEEGERIVRKVFTRKRVYLPDELAQAIEKHLAHPDCIVMGMNGFSVIKPDQLQRYDIEVGAYEAGCAAALRESLGHMRTKFPPAALRLVSGASVMYYEDGTPMGVDTAIEIVAEEFNIPCLGFSCPRFMLYVVDDHRPVYVAPTKDDYAREFIKALDILLATGGREHALQHDVNAACIFSKRIHFVDVLSMLSKTGSVPATITDAQGNIHVENAPAAFGRNVSFFASRHAEADAPPGGDKWDALFDNLRSVVTEVCREKLSAKRKFGH